MTLDQLIIVEFDETQSLFYKNHLSDPTFFLFIEIRFDYVWIDHSSYQIYIYIKGQGEVKFTLSLQMINVQIIDLDNDLWLIPNSIWKTLRRNMVLGCLIREPKLHKPNNDFGTQLLIFFNLN